MNDDPTPDAPQGTGHRPARRHPARRRPPLRPHAGSAARRPLGVGVARQRVARQPGHVRALVRAAAPLAGQAPYGTAPSGASRRPARGDAAAARVRHPGRPGGSAAPEAGRRRRGHRRRGVPALGRARLGRHRRSSLERAGAFDQTVAGLEPGAAQPAARPAARHHRRVLGGHRRRRRVGPAVVKITTQGAAHQDPFGSVPIERRRAPGSSTTPNGWILTNRHVVADARHAHRGAQGRPPVRGHGLRHRHPDRPRHRQGRRDRPARRAHRHAATASRSASSSSPSAARWAPTRSR